MLGPLGEELMERTFPHTDNYGRSVPLIHIGSGSVRALITRSKHPQKSELIDWLDKELSNDRPVPGKNSAKSSQPGGNDERGASSTLSNPESPKPKKARHRGYAITTEDYARLCNKSSSTIYKWVKDGKLDKLVIKQTRYIIVKERDLDYERIAEGMKANENRFGIVGEMKLEIIGNIEG